MKHLFTYLLYPLFLFSLSNTPIYAAPIITQEQVQQISNAPYRIIFIHLGVNLPSHTYTALAHARLFNPNAAIVLIASEACLETDSSVDGDWITIPAEAIEKTRWHVEFNRFSRLDKSFRNGFWYYTTERLFCLDDFITQYNLTDTFHVENDNLIYCDLEELLPIFRDTYKGIGAPFEQDYRGGAGFIFVADHASINALARYLKDNMSRNKSEMELLSAFKKQFGKEYIDQLPIISNAYVQDHLPLKDASGRQDQLDPFSYSQYADKFGSIFDMCSYGQYIGGPDPRNGDSLGPGYINPCAIFKCSDLELTWELDERNRKIPHMSYKGTKYRLNNLHIHCKDLNKFSATGLNK